MAQKPDGKAAKTERLAFTRKSVERIQRVVRIVEAGDRKGEPLRFERRATGGGGGSPFRICTFTGAWSIATPKTVTFKYQTTTPNTVSATNLFAELGTVASDPRDCAIAREGTAWFLIAAKQDCV